LHATNAPELRERLQCPDVLDHGLRHASRGVRTVLCDVVADRGELPKCGLLPNVATCGYTQL
jgi:hypothetical protein